VKAATLRKPKPAPKAETCEAICTFTADLIWIVRCSRCGIATQASTPADPRKTCGLPKPEVKR
jgi:hypothetical protein